MPHKVTTTFTRDSVGWGGRGFSDVRWTAWREETVIGEWRSRGYGWVFRDDGSRDIRCWRFSDWKQACRDA